MAYADGRRDHFALSPATNGRSTRKSSIDDSSATVCMGFDTVFGMSGLPQRYRDIDAERSTPHSGYRLHADDSFDVWTVVRAARLPWVDARYGSAVYLPMADDAVFLVSVGPGGLVARPRNDAARAAVSGWR